MTLAAGVSMLPASLESREPLKRVARQVFTVIPG
jgi:hypothetical protein